jgi:hypothetical protein
LPNPSSFLCPTGVNPFRGFIRPTFRANGINAFKNLEIRFSFDTRAGKLQSGGAHEASSGTHPGWARAIDSLTKGALFIYLISRPERIVYISAFRKGNEWLKRRSLL